MIWEEHDTVVITMELPREVVAKIRQASQRDSRGPAHMVAVAVTKWVRQLDD
jgi:hypothetical protein